MINIDFDLVDELLMAGCDGTQIAAVLGCHKETLYDRVKEIKKTDFSDYKAQKRAKGDAALLKAQYESAVVDKDRGMQIWLGKNRLGQTDKTQNTIELPQMKQITINSDGYSEQSNLENGQSI